MISELANVIQPYAWGSQAALAELRGAPTPTPTPEAELWMGAHPLAPSRLLSTGQSLDAAIAHAPVPLLGNAVASTYDSKLPFLLKVLAAATPLSLQAHPSLEQARAGFDADEAAGIPLDSPQRNYKDRNHKPELICALSEFWALCGFRDVQQTLALLDSLELPALSPYRALLAHDPDGSGISHCFQALVELPDAQASELARATTAACRAHAAQHNRYQAEVAWAARIGELYPGDVGVVSALLLNLLRLEPGEAIYLPAGNLHAYLGGTGVEIMASSDNVLRGGLTPKHVNVPELLRVVDFSPLTVEPLRAQAHGAEQVFETPAREFALSYFDLDGHAQGVDVAGPEIWLVTDGQVQLRTDAQQTLALGRGRSAFVSASSGALQLAGNGRIFRATVAHPYPA